MFYVENIETGGAKECQNDVMYFAQQTYSAAEIGLFR